MTDTMHNRKWAYYNDNSPYVCEWARNLIKAGLVMDGEVDERDIKEVQPGDLDGFIQVHFFAGLLGWPYALQLAGWGNRPCWTGSCPCQPWSGAGVGAGFSDERHLWPAWFNLIRQCRPVCLLGEQVASPLALQWFDALQNDLEGAGYAVGAADLCAAGVSAPHLRQRLFFVAHSQHPQRGTEHPFDAETYGWNGPRGSGSAVGNSLGPRLERRSGFRSDDGKEQPTVERAGHAAWSGAEWVYCRDEKYRLVKPSIQPLVARLPARMEQLRAIGNSICPQVAAEFIAAYLETEGDRHA